MSLRDVGFYLRGLLSRSVSRVVNAGAPALTAVPLEAVLEASGGPRGLVPLLEGRSNEAREAAVAAYLDSRGVPFCRHAFTSFEGAGENFIVDVGEAERTLVLIAHHDAVPGSPGANDNAAAVAILLTLLARLRAAPPSRLRVRLLFTAAEERGYLGARAYVDDIPMDGVVGVLSLELCGIGDSLAIWDVTDETPFLGEVRAVLGGLGLAPDDDYHVVGRIPLFGSDHRAFAAAGLPAYGLSVAPRREADALRSFVFNPVRSAVTALVRRPPPFDTYHTYRDAGATLDATALDRVLVALEAIVASL